MLQSFLQILGITDTRLRDPQTCYLHGIGYNLLPPTYVLTNGFLQFCFAKDLIVYDPIPQRFQNFVVQLFDFLYFQKYFLYFKKYFFLGVVIILHGLEWEAEYKYVLSLSYIRNHLYKKSLQKWIYFPPSSVETFPEFIWPSAQGFTNMSMVNCIS